MSDMGGMHESGSTERIQDLYQELNELDDPRECVVRIRETMARLTAAGLSVPEELVKTERRFQTECALQSQGR